ncbi:TPA: capsular polysaccharide synthesis protein [Streptococcus suis]
MMINPLISIVIPVYNQELYLSTSLESVINQTYSNIEVIIINDGSTDSSQAIIESYAKKDGRIRFFQQENGGLVDATLTGIKRTNGEYIAFLDPDDRLGNDFIENFVEQLVVDYDIVAMGYYLENRGKLIPRYLKQSKVYVDEELEVAKNSYLYERGSTEVSSQFFISRWNKLYKKNVVNQVVTQFESCRNISLGEDSIFTALVLSVSKSVNVIEAPNSYFYNVGNQNSMMKSSAAQLTLEKSKVAFDKLNSFDFVSEEQSLALYYFLIENTFQRLKDGEETDFISFYNKLKLDKLYQAALLMILSGHIDKKKHIELELRRKVSGKKYIILSTFFEKSKKVARYPIKEFPRILMDSKNVGLSKAIKLFKHRQKRRSAFDDMYSQISNIELAIQPFLEKYKAGVTDFTSSTIERNIFVFWWDGFDNAPILVKKCLDSIKYFNPSAQVIEISKDNFEEYTDINPVILSAFHNGDISVQTFSDILRFNLLKNHGGAWVDSTILFLNHYDIFDNLKHNSFNSISFSSSNSFLEYKNENCTWSGYFIASRKNAHFVTVMNNLFEDYYINYGDYPIYFFIDVLFMICKVNKIDNDVLSNTDKISGDMFLLSHLYKKKFNKYSFRLLKEAPQKLSWMYSIQESADDNFLKKIIKG